MLVIASFISLLTASSIIADMCFTNSLIEPDLSSVIILAVFKRHRDLKEVLLKVGHRREFRSFYMTL